MLFLTTKYSRDLNTHTCTRLVVVTPVIEGVDAPSIAVHVVPLYNWGLSCPFTRYRKDPPAVVTLACCHCAKVCPVTTAAPTAPAVVTSKIPVPAAAKSFAPPVVGKYSTNVCTGLVKPVTWLELPFLTPTYEGYGHQLSSMSAYCGFISAMLSRSLRPPTGAGIEVARAVAII